MRISACSLCTIGLGNLRLLGQHVHKICLKAKLIAQSEWHALANQIFSFLKIDMWGRYCGFFINGNITTFPTEKMRDSHIAVYKVITGDKSSEVLTELLIIGYLHHLCQFDKTAGIT